MKKGRIPLKKKRIIIAFAVTMLLVLFAVLPLCAAGRGGVFCKICGTEFSSVQSMSNSICSKSDSRRHVIYRGIVGSKYYCIWCGSKYKSLRDMSNSLCAKNPNARNHEVYEGNSKDSYVCRFCGNSFSSLREMANRNCSKNASKRHIAK